MNSPARTTTFQVVAIEGEEARDAWQGRLIEKGALKWNLEEHRVYVMPSTGAHQIGEILGEVKDFFRHGDRVMAEILWVDQNHYLNTTVYVNDIEMKDKEAGLSDLNNPVTSGTIREIFLSPYLPWGDGSMDPGFPKIDFDMPKVEMP